MQFQLSEISMFCIDTQLDTRPDSPAPVTTSAPSGETILWIHGFPLDHTMWQSQIDFLATGNRCIAPDLRGFGRSSRCSTSGITTMARFADDLDELLTQLSIREPITICGLSMGGYIALEMWQRHRARVGKLVLCDTRVESDSPEVARGRELMALQVEQDGMVGVADTMLPKLMAAQTVANDGDTVMAVRRTIENADPYGVAAAQRGMAVRDDFRERVPKIDVPTLVICGREDAITPVTGMRTLADALPNASFAEIPGAGHLAPLERPNEVNTAIATWIDCHK